jgi:hypothetical protein
MTTHGHRLISDLIYGTTIIKVRRQVDIPIFLVKARRDLIRPSRAGPEYAVVVGCRRLTWRYWTQPVVRILDDESEGARVVVHPTLPVVSDEDVALAVSRVRPDLGLSRERFGFPEERMCVRQHEGSLLI